MSPPWCTIGTSMQLMQMRITLMRKRTESELLYTTYKVTAFYKIATINPLNIFIQTAGE